MIPSSIKDFKGTFCSARIYEESCDFAFAMKNLNNASTIECFDSIELANGAKLTEKIENCEEEIVQRNGIIAACSVFGLLLCFFLTWKFAIIPNLPWLYR